MPEMGMKKAKASVRRRGIGDAIKAASISLADALFTTTQQRLLGLLYGQPHRTFFANELISMTRSGSGAVQRELMRLVASGLVTSQSIGRQRHYQANPLAPVYEELKSIIFKTVGLVDPLRAALKPLASHIARAILYGSVAQGKDTASSDIDLLIVSDTLTLERVYAALEPAEGRLGRKVSPTIYTSRDFEKRLRLGNPFLTRLLSGPHVDLIKDDHGSQSTDQSGPDRQAQGRALR